MIKIKCELGEPLCLDQNNYFTKYEEIITNNTSANELISFLIKAFYQTNFICEKVAIIRIMHFYFEKVRPCWLFISTLTFLQWIRYVYLVVDEKGENEIILSYRDIYKFIDYLYTIYDGLGML